MPLDIDRHADLASPLQRWDPRSKIAAMGLFVLSVSVVNTLPVAVLALLVGFSFLLVSRLPFGFVANGLKWVVFFLAPFFAIMPFTYPGEAAAYLLGLPFSWEGVRLAILIFIKAMAIVMTTFAMFGTARFDISMIALQHLKCPKIMTQMLLFSYRYTFVFLEEMRVMNTAMKARGFVPKTNMATLSVFGNFVGTLLVRSFERTERVYKAMLSKGYQGEFHNLREFTTTGIDVAKAMVIIVIGIAVLIFDRIALFTPAIQGWY